MITVNRRVFLQGSLFSLLVHIVTTLVLIALFGEFSAKALNYVLFTSSLWGGALLSANVLLGLIDVNPKSEEQK